MPLVKRLIRTTSDTVKGARTREHITYVKPGAMKPGDEIMRPTMAQMAELKAEHPSEYAQGGIGMQFGKIVGQEQEAHFKDLNAKEAAERVHLAANEEDADLLAKYMEWEAEREPPRKGVLKELAAAGQEAAVKLLKG